MIQLALSDCEDLVLRLCTFEAAELTAVLPAARMACPAPREPVRSRVVLPETVQARV